MGVLRVLFPDQLSETLPTLQNVKVQEDIIFLCEARQELSFVKHHKKKLVFILSAMRHFAASLQKKGYRVHYVPLENPQNTGDLDQELERFLKKNSFKQIVLTEPSEWRLLEKVKKWQKTLPIPVNVLEDDRFLCSIPAFKDWAGSRKSLRMEFFYRDMRKKLGLLMTPHHTPVEGRWNFDSENRQPFKESVRFPQRPLHKPNALTQKLMALVAEYFPDHFGDLEPFYMGVTRQEALEDLEFFMEFLLPYFGTYQDLMMQDEPFLAHSVLSFYLNIGLLTPQELCQKAEERYRQQKAPLNAVEGFIRQIIGWREYVRGIYWLKMPQYSSLNFFQAQRKLPDFYWTGQTPMACLAEAVHHTQKYAYSHHIQRLMVTGNFALLAGLDPREVCEWYLIVYADAYEWVELPNTLGMALFGDGGVLGSKPYAASGKYIHRMSNFCERCPYDPQVLVGEKACPFNYLYWDFLDRHRDKLSTNPRLAYMYSTLSKFDDRKRALLKKQAQTFLDHL